MKVDWYRLECFRVAGKLEHLSKAAGALGTSQPAVSRAIRQLEEQLGVLLFDRVGRSVRLTRNGHLLLEKIDKAYRDIEGIQTAIQDAGRTGNRPTHVGFMRSLGVRVVPQLVREYRSSYPRAQFEFLTSGGSAIYDLLESGDLDLILVAAPKERSSITWRKLFDQRMVAIASLDNPLARRTSVTIADLEHQPIVTFKNTHVMRPLTERIFEEAGIRPKISFEADDSSSIPGFVAAGLGVAIVAHDGEFPRDVVVLPTEGPLLVRPVGLAWIGDRFMSQGVKAFRDFTLRHAPRLFPEEKIGL